MSQIRFTQKGYEKLQKEYEELKKSRPFAVSDLAKARAMGDLSENGYYKAAKQKLSSIDYQLRTIATSLRQALIITKKHTDIVTIGTIVTLENTYESVTYEIVGDLEADPSNKKISLYSPIGKAIAGKKVGDRIFIQTPSKALEYDVVRIES